MMQEESVLGITSQGFAHKGLRLGKTGPFKQDQTAAEGFDAHFFSPK
jgi:hypothetical protein